MSVSAKKSGLRRMAHTTIALLLLLCVGCGDPGYRLHPVGWQSISDREWSRQSSDFEIRTRGIHGLIGDWWIDPDLQVYNNSKSISVESAKLRTATEEFFAEIYDTKSIPPSTSDYRLPVNWKFEETRAAREVLGDHCEIDLHLKIGGEHREIKIEYEKY